MTTLTVFSTLRVYALWDRNWLISSLVLSLNLVPVITNIVGCFSFRHSTEPELKTSEQYADVGESVSYVDDSVIGSYCPYAYTSSPGVLFM